MKYLPHAVIACACALFAAQSLEFGPMEEESDDRFGLSVAFEAGKLHFEAQAAGSRVQLHL